ncbi:hypothetical protein FS749_015599 [Ceratobasidium sp. UAMH 11750]|nr:hypothetical protein FS749_015599 [Ceratobasidium sp. UAMH 11750]
MVSAQGYYNVLVRLTNSLLPHQVPDRYREFLRVTRQWQHLQDLKRAGSTQIARVSQATADLVLRCPVCPQRGVNFQLQDIQDDDRHLYAQHVSIDGSFQLYRKNKSYDAWDICLSDGRKYFLESAVFDRFFQAEQARKGNKAAKDASCNNHRAANNTWVKFAGVAETGLASAICARHSFFLPRGTVSMWTGEQFLYADIVLVSVLSLALSEGVVSVGIYYNIICHYLIKMWERWSRMQPPFRPLSREDFEAFIAAIPKFHLAGHTLACYVRYSLNHIFGVGRMDAEGGERCWSNLNHAAGSTCDKGPGSRVDSLNHVMQQWNWSKTVEMAQYILRKWSEAKDMAMEHRVAFEQFHATLDAGLTDTWAALSLEPKLENGQWVSVFTLPETKATSMSSKIQELLQREQPAPSLNQPSHPPGLALWLSNALDIQATQKQLRDDIAEFGPNASPTQSRGITQRRKAIMSQAELVRAEAEKFFAFGQEHLRPSTNPEHDGQPEWLPLLLPSDYILPHALTHSQLLSIEAERDLRRILCLRELRRARGITMQRVHLNESKQKHARGIIATTRAASLGDRL